MSAKGKKKLGRPTKCTPKATKLICDGIEAGLPQTACAWKAGVPLETVETWTRKGEAEFKRIADGEEPDPHADVYLRHFIAFAEACARAVEESLKEAKSMSKDKKESDWKYYVWRLEKQFPKLFGRVETHKHVGDKDADPIKFVPVDDPKKAQEEYDRLTRENGKK